MKQPTRPVLRWHGGKWRLAPWIIQHFPPHTVYVEPFGGAASVLLRKPRSKSEIYGDLDESVVNLFRVLRSDRAFDLVRAVALTPFSRAEFDLAFEPADDPIERARRLIVRSHMGFGSNGHERRTGFRSKGYRAGKLPQHDWMDFPQPLAAVVSRMAGVVIERGSAMEIMHRYDELSALHYVDPPYLPQTRDSGGDYAHEMTFNEHVNLLGALRQLTGMVVLSGYASDLYDDALTGWSRVETRTHADGARPRVEVLWLNPTAATALDRHSMPLLAG